MSARTERARNVATVEALYEAERRRDIDAWESLWAEDGRHTFWFAHPTAPVVGRDDLVATTKRKFEVRPPYGIELVTEPLADPAKVLARLHLTDVGAHGGVVDIWCLVHFGPSGRITEIEEILDSAEEEQMPQ